MVHKKLCLQSFIFLQTFFDAHHQELTLCSTSFTVMSRVSAVAVLVLWMAESFRVWRHCSWSCHYICAISDGNVGWGNRHLDMGRGKKAMSSKTKCNCC